MTKVKKKVPVDMRLVDEDEPTAGEYETGTVAGRALKERIIGDPAGRAAYDSALQEIEKHQVSLAQVRKARSLAQATLAEVMGMDQSEISRLERRSDLLLSTVRRFIQATGGDLRLIVQYPDGDLELSIGEALSDEELVSSETPI